MGSGNRPSYIQMEITYSNSIAAVSCIVFFIVLWKLLNWAWFTPMKLQKKFKDQGFHGLPYRFSLGMLAAGFWEDQVYNSTPANLHNDDLVLRLLNLNTKLVDRVKFLYVWMGTTPTLTLLDHNLIKEVTLKNYNFLKVRHNPLAKLHSKGISSLDKDDWLKHRKIISPAFHVEKVKLMVQAFYASTRGILTEWEEIVSSKGGSCEIDVLPYLQKLTGDVISRTAFGSNYEEARIIFELLKEQAKYFTRVALSPYIPGWRFVPTKLNRRMKEISRIVNHKIRGIIDSRMKAIKAGGSCGKDFLGLLLESNIKEFDEHGNRYSGITIEDVIEESKLLYFSGQDTTSVLLVWTMILLAAHPEWQNRAREEVLQLVGNNHHHIPDHDALSQLKIVTMIFYEVLRLYPPATMLQRITTEDTKLGDFVIPKGVTLSLPVVIVQRSLDLWGDDANEFKPERFADGVTNATKGQFSYFPFGWGPRICAGQSFAMTEAKMAISMILQRFSFEIAPSYVHHPHNGSITLQPKYGAQLIFHEL